MLNKAYNIEKNSTKIGKKSKCNYHKANTIKKTKIKYNHIISRHFIKKRKLGTKGKSPVIVRRLTRGRYFFLLGGSSTEQAMLLTAINLACAICAQQDLLCSPLGKGQLVHEKTILQYLGPQPNRALKVKLQDLKLGLNQLCLLVKPEQYPRIFNSI